MKNILKFTAILLVLVSCENAIKNPSPSLVVEKGTIVENVEGMEVPIVETKKNTPDSLLDLIGFWVGYFEPDIGDNFQGKAIYADEGAYWGRRNKINISIDRIEDSLVFGHSVVAGNDRPFEGTIKVDANWKYKPIYFIEVNEPGDNKYDGVFSFKIKNNKLTGTWESYKEIDINKRKYTLEKRVFTYNAGLLLEKSHRYFDWNNKISEESTGGGPDGGGDEFEEWVREEFASATKKIYEINASNKLLEKSDVENLKKGDLTIIRNSIYARHGYSFKSRPLRVFFDAQSWYIPVHADIKQEFTEIEKKNIQLLLSFEKNAEEYYDYFGRG